VVGDEEDLVDEKIKKKVIPQRRDRRFLFDYRTGQQVLKKGQNFFVGFRVDGVEI
jgi:hypothetical protein